MAVGRFFMRLDAFGRPTDEMNMNDASQRGVPVTGGTFQAYYMAPALAHGIWTETYAMRARQGRTLVHFSAQRMHFLWDTVVVSLACNNIDRS